MKSLNKAQLIGYLGHDPVIRQCKNGNRVAILRLATHDYVKDRPQPWTTTWHNVRVWGENKIRLVMNELIKGSHIMIEGRMYYSTYPDAKGHIRYVTQVHAHRYINLDR